MSGANYRRGADLERAVKKDLEANGYYVIKSGGSKGLADLAAFKPGEILFVQCKRPASGYLAPAERIAFRQLALRLGVVPLAGYWAKKGRAARRVAYYEVTSMGPAGDWTPDHGMQSHPQAQENAQ